MSVPPRLPILALMLAAAALAAAEPEKPKTQNVDLGWCTVVLPLTVKVGELATYQITLKKVPEGAAKINLDLHWFDTAGVSKGMNTAGGAKAVVLDQPIEWLIKPAAKELIGKVMPVMYLSTDGTWATKLADKPPKLPSIDIAQP